MTKYLRSRSDARWREEVMLALSRQESNKPRFSLSADEHYVEGQRSTVLRAELQDLSSSLDLMILGPPFEEEGPKAAEIICFKEEHREYEMRRGRETGEVRLLVSEANVSTVLFLDGLISELVHDLEQSTANHVLKRSAALQGEIPYMKERARGREKRYRREVAISSRSLK